MTGQSVAAQYCLAWHEYVYFIEYNEKNNSGEFISTFGPTIFNYINFNSFNLIYRASYSRLEVIRRNSEPHPDQTTVAGKTPKHPFNSKERRGEEWREGKRGQIYCSLPGG